MLIPSARVPGPTTRSVQETGSPSRFFEMPTGDSSTRMFSALRGRTNVYLGIPPEPCADATSVITSPTRGEDGVVEMSQVRGAGVDGVDGVTVTMGAGVVGTVVTVTGGATVCGTRVIAGGGTAVPGAAVTVAGGSTAAGEGVMVSGVTAVAGGAVAVRSPAGDMVAPVTGEAVATFGVPPL